jgi:hypothetical protein
VYENTGDDDKMSGEKTGFYTKMHHLREDQQESVGLIDRKCIDFTIILGEGGPKIGSSAHRRSTESVLDGPMTRWSGGPIAAARDVRSHT